MSRQFSTARGAEDRSIVYETTDSWEAQVIRSALLSENIPATVRVINLRMEGLSHSKRVLAYTLDAIILAVLAGMISINLFWSRYSRHTITGYIGIAVILVFRLVVIGQDDESIGNRIIRAFLWWKNRQTIIFVPASKEKEAQMVIRRTSIVISKKEEMMIVEEERESQEPQAKAKDYEAEQPLAPETKPTSEPVLVAEKDDVGEIFYYEAEDVYELRLEMESYKGAHFMDAEEWEEFIDFSAQRQEFFILLKEKYPGLASYLKENKMRPDFLRLIEYSYGKSQPPKK